jgi:putative DNA primase/helicase
MALMKQLYYWCKPDVGLMNACFRSSGRMRPKWDDTYGEQTYAELTIAKIP